MTTKRPAKQAKRNTSFKVISVGKPAPSRAGAVLRLLGFPASTADRKKK